MGVLFQASNKFSIGVQGVPFDHATDPKDVCIGIDGSIGTPGSNGCFRGGA